jgi:DNA-binding SARP family transcriptional activator/pimeloyl-ACP methyl ester carboxylesterase
VAPTLREACIGFAARAWRSGYDRVVLVLRVLGPLDVERDGVSVAISSAKQRLVLGVLAATRSVVSRSRLIDALWPDDPPTSAANTLMGYVSRLRAALGSDVIVSRGDGYLLQVDEVDAQPFEDLARSGGLDALAAALALWRGPAFGDLAEHPFLIGEARRLDELRTQARLNLAAGLFENGDRIRPISILEALVGDEPAREDVWVQLILTLGAAGRAGDASDAARRCRVALADVGLSASLALAEAERAALTGTPVGGAGVFSRSVDVGPVRYTTEGGVHLAYQVVGGGQVDLVLSSYGSISIDAIWDNSLFASFVTRLAAAFRVVLYDTRGVGLSDPIDVRSPPGISEQTEDLRRVLERAGTDAAIVVGVGDGGPVAISAAATLSPRVQGLVLVNTFARLLEAPGYRGISQEQLDDNIAVSTDPGTTRDTSLVLRNHAPSVAADTEFRRWWERSGRRGASPATAEALWRVRYGADVRPMLADVDIPTWVLHRRECRVVPIGFGRYLAEHIDGATFFELDGADQPPFTGDSTQVTDLILSFG